MMSSAGVVALLVLMCVAVLAFSLWAFCYLAKHGGGGDSGEATAANDGREMGLSAAQLERLPRIRGDSLVVGN
nr:E3 ubiquitin-protein ligase ATL23-like [Ipomoea trifida]